MTLCKQLLPSKYICLPSSKDFVRNKCQLKSMICLFVSSKFTDRLRHIVQVEWIPYLDEIACEFGAKVDMGQLFRSDFKLWAKLFFGPSVPYQYRLTGPHSWPGARDAILKVRERMDAPLRASNGTKELTCRVDQVSHNPRYWDHGIIYTIFYGVIVVTLLDMMNIWY